MKHKGCQGGNCCLFTLFLLFMFILGGVGGGGMFDDEFVCINMCFDVVVFKY